MQRRYFDDHGTAWFQPGDEVSATGRISTSSSIPMAAIATRRTV